MGPFLASRVPSGLASWLCGVAVVASAVSLATLPDDFMPAPTPTSKPAVWNQRGCHPAKPAAPVPTIYIGPMTDGGTHREVLQETVRATLGRHRAHWNVEITDQPMTVANDKLRGFYLEGTVEDLHTTEHGANSTIKCKVTMWIAGSGGKEIGVTSGAANVLTSRDRRDVDLSRQGCIEAVVENLVEKQLLGVIEHPTLSAIDRDAW